MQDRQTDSQSDRQTDRPAPPAWEPYGRKVAEIRARAASARDAAHFGHLAHMAGPFRLRQMLPLDALLLYATANPLFNGRRAARCSVGEILIVLLVLDTRRGWLRRWRIATRLLLVRRRARAWARLLEQLDAYVAETFIDLPAHSGGTSARDHGPGLRPSFLSSLIHLIAAEYHWGRAEILATPMRELLLYRKHISAGWMAKAGTPLDDTTTEELALKDQYLRALEAWQINQARAAAARN